MVLLDICAPIEEKQILERHFNLNIWRYNFSGDRSFETRNSNYFGTLVRFVLKYFINLVTCPKFFAYKPQASIY
jgi:hypothetical protein